MTGRRGNASSSGTTNDNNVVSHQFEDTSSPYYLHPSDNPAHQLVSQHLIGSNYTNWSRSVITALIAKNKLQFVNGVLPRPPDGDLLLPAWIRCNSMVVSWIRNSISPQICSSIMYLEDAREIWLDLRDRFSVCDSARVYQLRQKIMALSQGNDDINDYFTNLRIVWDEYKDTQPVSWCVCTTCRCHSSTKWRNHQEKRVCHAVFDRFECFLLSDPVSHFVYGASTKFI